MSNKETSSEEKLRKILEADLPLNDFAIAQVKQAFKSEGYGLVTVPLSDVTVGQLMTGQDFYDRIVKEVEKFNYDNRGGLEIYWSEHLEQAAKRAAGLVPAHTKEES